jgi:hypothetical protein
MRNSTRTIITLTLLLLCGGIRANAQGVPIDATRSTLTINVFKSGLFSGFGDEHIVRAPIAKGQIVKEGQPGVVLTVQTAQMQVLDPHLSAEKRAQVQKDMLSEKVLAPQKFPEIVFRSTAVEPRGKSRWLVRGELSLHGVTRPLDFEVTEANGHYTGKTRFKQTEFKIEPPGIPGGFVKAKDEVEVVWDIVPTQ